MRLYQYWAAKQIRQPRTIPLNCEFAPWWPAGAHACPRGPPAAVALLSEPELCDRCDSLRPGVTCDVLVSTVLTSDFTAASQSHCAADGDSTQLGDRHGRD